MAYPNATINEGDFGTFWVDAAGAVTLYQRVKFSTTAAADNKPTLVVAGVTDRGNAIVMAPAAASTPTVVRFLNAQGEQFGQASGTIGIGVAVYTAALGVYSATQGSGLLAGISTTAGYDGGPFTFLPIVAAA